MTFNTEVVLMSTEDIDDHVNEVRTTFAPMFYMHNAMYKLYVYVCMYVGGGAAKDAP